MKAKKILVLLLVAALALAALTGCGKTADGGDATTDEPEGFDAASDIGVISREDGSGTRGAFIELFGIEQKDADGNKVDHTDPTAAVTNSTSVMMTTVAGDLYAIGYISLGSMNDTVKSVSIDGAEASVENIENGSYKIARPFNIVTGATVSDDAQDFIDFILSAEGQSVVEENGYIAVSDAAGYTGSGHTGKIVVSGSSSVTPVMEKLKEAYQESNPDATIEVQQSDSSTGVQNTIDGVCDIGMASRELKDSETEAGVSATVIAMDGIAVIVNNGSTVTALTSEQVMKIFTGELTKWSDVIA